MNYEQRMKIIVAAIAAETAVTIDKNLEKRDPGRFLQN